MSQKKIKKHDATEFNPDKVIVIERAICVMHKSSVPALWKVTLPSVLANTEIGRKYVAEPFLVCENCMEKFKSLAGDRIYDVWDDDQN